MHVEGLLIGLFCYAIIGIFHPIVVKGQFCFTNKIWPVFLLAGISCLVGAAFIDEVIWSAMIAIAGVGFLWSISELKELTQSVSRGWFPKKPSQDKCIEQDDISKIE